MLQKNLGDLMIYSEGEEVPKTADYLLVKIREIHKKQNKVKKV